ncbi:hypothetical protein Droror1_Dr00022841 [Drosera rotundifolia]
MMVGTRYVLLQDGFVFKIRGSMILILVVCVFGVVHVNGLAAMDSLSLYDSSRPKSVNVGALITFDSVIGRAMRPAIQAAVDDVNVDSSVLQGTRLEVFFHDTNCSGFFGIVDGYSRNYLEFQLI